MAKTLLGSGKSSRKSAESASPQEISKRPGCPARSGSSHGASRRSIQRVYEAAGALQERPRERALPRADLEDDVLGVQPAGLETAPRDRGIVEEILPKADFVVESVCHGRS